MLEDCLLDDCWGTYATCPGLPSSGSGAEMGKSTPISISCAPACVAVDLWRAAFQCGGQLQQGKELIGKAMGPCSVQGCGTAVTGITKGQAQPSPPASASSANLRHFSGTPCPSRT